MESEKVKEIKKALECCCILTNEKLSTEERSNACNDCPYNKISRCAEELDKKALTLINELESENERLILQYERVKSDSEMNCIELKDRIAELENTNYYKEFEKKKEELSCKEYGFIKYEKEVVVKYLSKLAERFFDLGNFVNKEDIDETLKEFINESI